MDAFTWRRVVALGTLLAAMALALPAEAARDVAWLALAGLGAAAVAAGVRRHRPGTEGSWWLLSGGAVLAGAATVVAFPLWASPQARPVSEAVALAAYLALGLAVLGFARGQAPGGHHEAAVDASIMMIAAAALLQGAGWWRGAAVGDGAAGILVLAAPVLLAGVAAAAARVLLAGGALLPSAWLLLGASLAGLGGTLWRAAAVAGAVPAGTGPLAPGGPGSPPLVLVPLGVALAALHPSMRELSRRARASRWPAAARLVMLAAATASPLAVLLVTGRGGAEARVPLAASAALGLLALGLLGRHTLVRANGRGSRDARETRQRALACLGSAALDGVPLDELFERACRACDELLGLRRSEVKLGPAPRPAHPGTRAVRLGCDGRTLGALVAVRGEAWDDEDAAFLQSVANVLSAAVERDETRRAVRHQATHDTLTGLPNRTRLRGHLARTIERAGHGDDGIAVLLVDIDGFKRVNHDFGQAAGDELLLAVARRLKGVVRPDDLLARVAADEFAVVCPVVDREAAEQVATRIAWSLTEPFALGERTIDIAGSIGVALGDGRSAVDRLLADAGAAMGRAKAYSGARVEVFDEGAYGPAERGGRGTPYERS